ncbi:unnamed protein product [Closterium sp. Naga37s-1]|nr:unnamed protein product [Closterium sp. Naga37s-1]
MHTVSGQTPSSSLDSWGRGMTRDSGSLDSWWRGMRQDNGWVKRAGMRWGVLGCAGVCWDVLGCAGVCWGVLRCTGGEPSALVASPVHPLPPPLALRLPLPHHPMYLTLPPNLYLPYTHRCTGGEPSPSASSSARPPPTSATSPNVSTTPLTAPLFSLHRLPPNYSPLLYPPTRCTGGGLNLFASSSARPPPTSATSPNVSTTPLTAPLFSLHRLPPNYSPLLYPPTRCTGGGLNLFASSSARPPPTSATSPNVSTTPLTAPLFSLHRLPPNYSPLLYPPTRCTGGGLNLFASSSARPPPTSATSPTDQLCLLLPRNQPTVSATHLTASQPPFFSPNPTMLPTFTRPYTHRCTGGGLSLFVSSSAPPLPTSATSPTASATPRTASQLPPTSQPLPPWPDLTQICYPR